MADVHRGWVKALKACGCQVVDWPFDAALEFYEKAKDPNGLSTEEAVRLACNTVERMAYRFWPDVILITSAFYVPTETLDLFRDRGHTVVLLHTESPYEDDRQIARAEHVSVNVVNDPTNIDRFPPGTVYLPHCYDPDIHYPGPSSDPSDFCLVGTGYPSRIRFLEAVDWSGLDAILAGNWQALGDDSPLHALVGHSLDECLPNELAADLYRGTRSSLNLYRREAEHAGLVDGWAMGPREVELAACGAFYLTEERGENRDVLPMVPTVDSPEDFAEQLAWWLAHDRQREAVAEKARDAIADRTFLANARKLLEIVNQ